MAAWQYPEAREGLNNIRPYGGKIMLIDGQQIVYLLLSWPDLIWISRVDMFGGTDHELPLPWHHKDGPPVRWGLYVIDAIGLGVVENDVSALYKLDLTGRSFRQNPC